MDALDICGRVAEQVAAGAEVDVIQATDFDVDKLAAYDAVAFGCPAMGAEVLEEFEFEPMYNEVEPQLGTCKVVLFGSYDWSTGEWMETWEARAEEAGENVVDAVIANLDPDAEAISECQRVEAMLA